MANEELERNIEESRSERTNQKSKSKQKVEKTNTRKERVKKANSDNGRQKGNVYDCVPKIRSHLLGELFFCN